MIRRGAKDKLTSYLYILYFCGFVNILAILDLVFFQVLPNLVWREFFYSLGSAGARIYYMILFGCEIFILLCEAFIAVSRYLTFIRSDLTSNYWNTDRIKYWLLAIVGVSVAYASTYFFCDFWTAWDADKKVRFEFASGNLDWVAFSMFFPFTVATISFLCCLYCYWKVATILRGSQTGLTRPTAVKMCLSSAIISFGSFLSLLVRIVNHLSYVILQHDLIPYAIFYLIVRVGALIATCGNPWILIALFPTVREKAFPCWKRNTTTAVGMVSTIPAKANYQSMTVTHNK
ncbi:unnamed protein product [Cylicocyclus nassatus]|uniref:Uncharacterized protein n=1 Tax=Cylicocyclus nassatus TaxID=53992 RepID=A0AA36MGH9_CYLNA|nr:unnamed protein product [Cylicocyclus nassatus]